MAIYDHKYGDLSYFRVFRAWGGKEHQEYIRIKKSRKAAYAKALEVDKRMAKEQREYCIEQARKPEYHVKENGHIRGLRRITIKRQGRMPADVFELRINVPWEENIKRTTISIAVHGEQKAFDMALSKICEWYGLEQGSEVQELMLAQQKYYLKQDSTVGNVAEFAIKKAKDEFASITDGFVKGFKRFTA